MPVAKQTNSSFFSLIDFLEIDAQALTQALHQCGASTSFAHLRIDSRQCDENSIFVAIAGSQDKGANFIAHAAKQHCKLAFCETAENTQNGQITITKLDNLDAIVVLSIVGLGKKVAEIAEQFYFSNNNLIKPTITAVTGTNGKTSVVSLLGQLASLCKRNSATIGTLGLNTFSQGKQTQIAQTTNTSPDILTMFDTIQQLSADGCDALSIEASSHGLTQGRLLNLPIACAVFTNLSQDHLDYHKTMQDYAQAKRKLIDAKELQYLVLNANDKESLIWQQQATNAIEVLWFSFKELPSTQQGCWASNVEYHHSGLGFELNVRLPNIECTISLHSPLIGTFNLANLLAAITALLALGYSLTDICEHVPNLLGVAGRMELFASDKASILVDYAHTPDALKQALLAARAHTKGQVICVFGCGGDRDKSKRALMGEIACELADYIVLTQDNSRCESPLTIIEDIKQGINSNNCPHKLKVIVDREKAIEHAWKHSQANDTILLAGKGHENYIEINNTKIAYNEREYVAKLVELSAKQHISHTTSRINS